MPHRVFQAFRLPNPNSRGQQICLHLSDRGFLEMEDRGRQRRLAMSALRPIVEGSGEILRELGFSEAEFEALLRSGAVTA